MLRPVVLRIHRWVGLALGAYALVIGVTGAVLVFRQDLQAATYPRFFDVAPAPGEPLADVSTVLRAFGEAYPDHTISGLDWPTFRRGSFLAYVSRGAEFRTVFAHPATGQVIGELPYDWIRRIQELHFNLLGGPAGLVVNGVAAGGLLVLCLTGPIVWWPGLARWAKALQVSWRPGWRRVARELHGAAGMWIWLLLVLWSVTGLYFAFAPSFRAAIDVVAPLTLVRGPESRPGGGRADVTPETLVARARAAVPAGTPARLVMPFGDRGTFLVVMARAVHGDHDTTDEVSLYFDRHTGDLLRRRDHAERTAGDALLAWVLPLHAGAFGGQAIRLLWALFGLACPLLALTGAAIWWSRRPG